MANLKNIWIEDPSLGSTALRIDWDNDRHQRIAIEGRHPKQLIYALEDVILLLKKEIESKKI